MLVTILYEDSPIGRDYPLHKLVLQMALDDALADHWTLAQQAKAVPKKGIDALLCDLPNTSLIAGDGLVFILVDRDKIIRHIHKNRRDTSLAHDADDAQIVAALAAMSDAPERLRSFLLMPNMEGLIRALTGCAPGRWTAQVEQALRKVLAGRDYVLTQAHRAAELELRRCIRAQQTGLDALVGALIEALELERRG